MDITIAIPVYNQPHLLRQFLDSLIQQREYFKSVYLFDDCSSKDYESLIKVYNNLSINYTHNSQNLGALPNMQHAYRSVMKSKISNYIMVAHEDDILADDFFSIINSAFIVSKKRPALILSYFNDLNNFKVSESLTNNIGTGEKFAWVNKKDLVERFIRLDPIAFGSAIYNTERYADFIFDFKKYGEFADRPFLLNYLNDSDDVLLLSHDCYFLRSHEENDTRWKVLKPRHISNLISLYWNTIQFDQRKNKREIKKFLASFYADSYKNLQLSGNTRGWFLYAIFNIFTGRISAKYFLLKQKHINQFFTWLLSKK